MVHFLKTFALKPLAGVVLLESHRLVTPGITLRSQRLKRGPTSKVRMQMIQIRIYSIYTHTHIYIYGWLSKCWFLNSAILPQLLAARLIIIMWAYHTFSLANFKVKCVLRSRRSSAGSLFSPRCSHWCYCCHYLLGWFFCWLA